MAAQQPVQQTQTQPPAPAPKKQVVQKPATLSKLQHIDVLLVTAIVTCIVSGIFTYVLESERHALIQEKETQAEHEHQKRLAAAISSENIQLINKAFIKETDVVPFIQTLEKNRQLFTGFDLSFDSDQPEGTKPKYLTFELLLEGPVENIHAFIDALLSSPFLIDVTNMELIDKNGFSENASLTLKGNLYIQSP